MSRCPHSIVLVTLLFLLAGCLEFDAQEITFRYDQKLDRIDALVVYRGLVRRNPGNRTSTCDRGADFPFLGSQSRLTTRLIPMTTTPFDADRYAANVTK